jgi:peptidoglycan/LPS O-acetylase OafA/YrhL
VNPVAWSLEIEVQFYLLVPLLALLFSISNTQARRAVLLLGMLMAGFLTSPSIMTSACALRSSTTSHSSSLASCSVTYISPARTGNRRTSGTLACWPGLWCGIWEEDRGTWFCPS